MPIIKPFQLNLLNFESPAAVNCQYILTSPRSLKACKKAGIKPVELLHRNLSDIEEDLNLTRELAIRVYEDQETDRQAKIQICLNIRNKLVTEEVKQHVESVANIEIRGTSVTSSRKDILDKENLLRASSTSSQFSNKVTERKTTAPLKEHETEKKQLSTSLKTESSTSPSPVSICSSKYKNESPQFYQEYADLSNILSSKRIQECCSSHSSPSVSPVSTPRHYSLTFPVKRRDGKSNKKRVFHKKKGVKKQSVKLSSTNQEIDDESVYRILPNKTFKRHPQIVNYFNGKFINTKRSSNLDCDCDEIFFNEKYENECIKNNTRSDLRSLSGSPLQRNDTIKNEVTKKKVNNTFKNYIHLNNHAKEKDGGKITGDNNTKCGFKKRLPMKQGSLQNLSTNKLKKERQFCSSSNIGSIQPRRSLKNYAFLNIDSLKIPESDRRILETLALKKEQEIESEELAYRAHLHWEADQQRRRQTENLKKKKWQKYVEEKRRIESQENFLRMEEIKESLRLSQKILEENLRKRDENTEKLRREAEERKILEILERKNLECKKRAAVDANLREKQLSSAIYQQKLQQELEERLVKAENVREKEREINHRRVASANRIEELRHQENLYDVTAEKELVVEQKRRELELKEEKARQHHLEYLKHREKHIQENRVDRELRLEMAKEIQRDLEKGLEAWQDRVYLLQCAAIERATASANMHIENKRLQAECENAQRQLEHSYRFRRVKELEDLRKESIMNLIKVKEEKISHLQRQKEKALQEGREQAHITADLREELRRTLTPETFDRKVARAEIELRVGNRPLTASPTMMESHIHLG